MNKNEIILFETSDHTVKLNVNTDGETVWLNRTQLAELFDRDISVIGRHINAVFKEKELEKESNVQNMHIPNSDRISGNGVVPPCVYRVDGYDRERIQSGKLRKI